MAGLIPRNFIDDLLARTDIVELIDQRVKLKKAGKSYVACCPFHGEKTPSFNVSMEKQFYHCFGCGVSGNAISFLMEYDRLEFPDAIEELAARFNLEVPRESSGNDQGKFSQRPKINKQQQLDYYELMQQVSRFYQQQLKTNKKSAEVIDYLKKRGLSGEIAQTFGIGYSPDDWQVVKDTFGKGSERQKQLLDTGVLIQNDKGRVYDRFRNRVMFPIRDRRGRVIGFGGRVLDDSTPKYLNSPETPIFHKGMELYGFYEARQAHRELKRLLVVEGYMDVVALAQHGVSYAVASLGTSTTAEQIQLMFRNSGEIVCCYDGDRAGRDAAWRTLENALPQLQDGRQIKFMFLPDGEDPDSLIREIGQKAFEALIDEALPLSQFMFDNLLKQVDMGSEDGRSKLAKLALPLVNNIADGVFQQMMKEKLAKYLGVDLASLDKFIEPKADSPARQHRKQVKQVTPVRQAVGLLLQHPELVKELPPLPDLSQIKIRGTGLLQQLLDMVRQEPDLLPVQLLERWRQTPEYQALGKMAVWQHNIEPEHIQQQFYDTIGKLLDSHLELRLEELASKDRTQGLSKQERQEFAQLIQAKG